MLIDKSKFLVLVATISAASTACIIVDGDSDGNGAGNEGAGDQGGGKQTTTSTTTATGTGGAGGGSDCLGDEEVTVPACASTCEGFTNCGGVDQMKTEVAADMVTCLNALDPATCSFVTDVIEGCYFSAANQACPDPASDATCATAATACGAEGDADWEGQCLGVSDSLTTAGQSAFGACLSDSCAQGLLADDALTACIYSLFPTG